VPPATPLRLLRARIWQAWRFSILREQAWPECGPLSSLYQSALERLWTALFARRKAERLEISVPA